MNAKHTPWKIDATPNQVCVMQGSLCIADCGAGDGAYEHARQIVTDHNNCADAALLAALQACESALLLSGDRFNDHKAALVDQARAAIAKATEK